MIWKCNLCATPCYLSMNVRPVPHCLHPNRHGVHSEWVETDGVFLSEVPA